MTAEMRDRIVSALTRLVGRRQRLRREIALEAVAALVAGFSALLATGPAIARATTAGLALTLASLAARDRHHLGRVQQQIDTLARVIAPFV